MCDVDDDKPQSEVCRVGIDFHTNPHPPNFWPGISTLIEVERAELNCPNDVGFAA